jgi:hypothetical protein
VADGKVQRHEPAGGVAEQHRVVDVQQLAQLGDVVGHPGTAERVGCASLVAIAVRSGRGALRPGLCAALRGLLDNCFRDQAVTNAAQPADLLTGADAVVVSPSG